MDEMKIHQGYDFLLRELDIKALCNKVEKFNLVARMHDVQFMKILEDFVFDPDYECHSFDVVKGRGGSRHAVEKGWPWKSYYVNQYVNGGADGDTYAGQCWVSLGRGWYFTWYYRG